MCILRLHLLDLDEDVGWCLWKILECQLASRAGWLLTVIGSLNAEVGWTKSILLILHLVYKWWSLLCPFFSFFTLGVIFNFLTMDFGFYRSGGFLDLETDTNPIDRSVAHLLFHRPSDPSLMPAGGNTLSLKSHKLVCSLTFQFQFSSFTVWNRITSTLRNSRLSS